MQWERDGEEADGTQFSESEEEVDDEVERIQPQGWTTDAEEEVVAAEAGLGTRVSVEEMDFLPPSFTAEQEGKYLGARNHIVTRWRQKPWKFLTQEAACSEIRDSVKALARAAYAFLNSHGYINFGLNRPSSCSGQPEGSGRVVVIGAGLAGLACAKHLHSLGHAVELLEARQRPGGRVHCVSLNGGCADIGGSIVYGSKGNPLVDIAKQMGVDMLTVGKDSQLYWSSGERVDEAIDTRIEREHNNALDHCARAMKHLRLQGVHEVSLGTALRAFSPTFGSETDPEALLWHWHISNIEYSNAAIVEDLSAAYWDQDDPYEFPGDHVMLFGGNDSIVQRLADGVPITYGESVVSVEHGEDGCRVSCESGKSIEADAVVCTVPLGVLKRGKISFDPDLPEEKKQAIDALGYGLLNKVILSFPERFWEEGTKTFGYCPGGGEQKGDAFLFYVYSEANQGNVLIALVAGKAAYKHEERTDQEAVERVMSILRTIFTSEGKHVPEPSDYYVTRWQSDPHAGGGSYSYVAVGATGEEYQTLGAPVGDRLFFAGEATTRLHPATMHGAFSTGRLAAAKIATLFRKLSRKERGEHLAGAKRSTPSLSMLAPLAYRLRRTFQNPDLKFGHIFAAVFDPRPTDNASAMDSPALLQITLELDRRRKEQRRQPIYLQLKRRDVFNLLSQSSDEKRLASLRDRIIRRSGIDYAGMNVLRTLEAKLDDPASE